MKRLQFQLPLDMMKWFDPYKNESKYIKGKDKIQHKCAWEPLPPISFGEMELFLTDIAGMIKVEQSPYEVNIILQNQGRDHPGMQYVCSYTFPDEKTRDKWALPNEINMNHDMDLEYKAQLEKYPDELFLKANIETIWRTMEFCDTRRFFVNKYKLLNVYSSDGVYFDDFQSYGGIPKIVRYSLFHLLGKAPIPEETYSEWYMYLQFLIDIGHVKEV